MSVPSSNVTQKIALKPARDIGLYKDNASGFGKDLLTTYTKDVALAVQRHSASIYDKFKRYFFSDTVEPSRKKTQSNSRVSNALGSAIV